MKKNVLVVMGAILLLASCGKDTGSGGGTPQSNPQKDQPVAKTTFQWLNTNVIQPKCLSCHGEAHPVVQHRSGRAIRLSSYAHVMEFITPKDPSHSELYSDVARGDMPRPKGHPLPTDEVQAFHDWIVNGANQN